MMRILTLMVIGLLTDPKVSLADEMYVLQEPDCDFVAWSAGAATKFRDEGRTKIETIYLFWSDYKVEIPRYRALMNVTAETIDKVYGEWSNLSRDTIVELTTTHCVYRVGEWLSTEIQQ